MKKKIKTVDEIVECSTDNVPLDEQSSSPRSVKHDKIREYDRPSNGDWTVSYHPFCKSCYEVYKTQCKEIETYFDIKNNSKELDLPKIKSKIDIIIDKHVFDQEYLHKIERIIDLLFDCITSRLFHHNSCYGPPSDDTFINLNVVKSNEEHYIFLKNLSVVLKRVYVYYVWFITELNEKYEALYENIFLKYKPCKIDIVRNIIKNYGDAKDKQNIDTIFNTPSKKQLKCKGSPIRKTRMAQQSRVSESYLIYKEDMDRILKKHPPKPRSKENSKKHINLKKKHNKDIKKYFVENFKRSC